MDFIWIQEQVCAPTLQFDDRQKKKKKYICATFTNLIHNTHGLSMYKVTVLGNQSISSLMSLKAPMKQSAAISAN